MLNPDRRAIQTAGTIVANNPLLNGTDNGVRELAGLIWQWMHDNAYAHITPQAQFVDSFVWSFRMNQLCKTVPLARV